VYLTLDHVMKRGLHALPLLLLLVSPFLEAGHDIELSSHPSPYLQSHADDAVHWRVNESAAINQAREEGKLIFLSSGYQSCYWCYRMKQDTFSDDNSAALINDNFLPILIDRELEPHLDSQLQQILAEQRGVGGWPANVILTPEGYPVASFSYADPDNLIPGLSGLLERRDSEPEQLVSEGRAILARLEQEKEASERLLSDTSLADLLQRFLQQSNAAADTTNGGFGDSEKYPHLPQLQALLALTAVVPDASITGFIRTTLDAMLQQGLRDQLGGGFFRYTTDRQWRTPHYEQMLHTQALAIQVLMRAGNQFREQRYTDAAEAVLLNMLRAFRRDDGLFRSSLSAVGNDGKDGGHYLWQPSVLETLLGPEWQGQLDVLVTTPDGILPRLEAGVPDTVRMKLLNSREQQAPPADDKALLGLNGLVLSALAAAETNPQARKAGDKLAGILNSAAESGNPSRLLDRNDAGPAGLDDLVYAARGLFDWSLASGDARSASNAGKLLHMAHSRYYDQTHWLEGDLAPLPGSSRSLLIQDTQLPSPAALWIDTAWRLAESSKDKRPGRLADTISLVWPQALYDNTFFHATWLAAMIERRVRLSSAAAS
jgi:uncharacterized protein YyaL (SSP411 family)